MNLSNSLRTLLLSALVAGPALAQVQVTLGAARDNTLYMEATGALSNGAGSFFFAGQNLHNETRRGLLRFDVAALVPAGSTILTADLTLDMNQTPTGPVTVTLHKVLADWGEGTSKGLSGEGGGAAATTNDATWVHRFFPGSPWTTVGGDFTPSPSGSQTVDVIGPYTWSSTAGMVADVQGWLDSPSTNFGWLVKGDENFAQTAKRFASKDNANPAIRPSLKLTIRPPAARVVLSGTGCGTPAFTTAAVGLPSLGNATFALSAAGGPASGLSLLFLSVKLSPVPIPLGGGCFLYLDPTVLFLLQAQVLNGAGAGNHPLPIPTDLSLVGVGLPMQLFGVDLANPGTIRSSNAATIFIGS